jgi:hypothetical protein
MTPRERQRVAELFDRLAMLEREKRDPEAERAIMEGLAHAPNAVYALVQIALVQDEALKHADARIRELEAHAGAEAPQSGFLDSMRGALAGHGAEPRGSVPAVRPDGHDTGSVWGTRPAAAQPMGNSGMTTQSGSSGSSFLGTAAAAAAGMIGGSLLLDSFRSMPGSHGAPRQSASDPGNPASPSPWNDRPAESGLAREAGLDDIGKTRSAAFDESNQRAATLISNDDRGAGDASNIDDGMDLGGDIDMA